jgi:uncharacterized protein YjbJ (UPF0337 family)
MAGTRDKAEGKWQELKGKGKEKVGDVTDDESLQAEGKKDELKGKGKHALGTAKHVGRDLKEEVKDATDR